MRRVTLIAAVMILATWGVAQGQDSHDVEEGQKTFKRVCFSCHAAEAGKNKIGPSLFGVVGRESAEVPGFKFSQAAEKSDVTWTEENLDKYLTDPKKFMPGNKMAFTGIKKAEERRQVIAYLKSLR